MAFESYGQRNTLANLDQRGAASLVGSAMEGMQDVQRMSQVGLQNKHMEQQNKQAEMTQTLQKAQAFSNEMMGMSKMSPQQRAQAWPQIRQNLLQSGIATPEQAPEQADESYFRSMIMKAQQTAPAIENKLKEAQTAKLYADAGQQMKQGTEGKMLPADKVLAVSEGQRLPTMLQDIRGTIEANADAFGPVSGRLAGMNPYNEKAQTIDAQMRTASQSFGRLMEGGVLRKEDEEKYRKMFPQLSDTPEVAANKLALVDRALRQKQGADVKALKSSGYDTAAFDSDGAAPELPAALQGDRKASGGGLIAEAQASSVRPAPKGKILMQGPDGSMKYVPVSMKGEAIAAGGKVVK